MCHVFEGLWSLRHGYIFCSNIQFARWTDATKILLNADFGSSDGSLTEKNEEGRFSAARKNSIVYVWDQSNDSQNPRKSLHHINKAEHTIHFDDYDLDLTSASILWTITPLLPCDWFFSGNQPRFEDSQTFVLREDIWPVNACPSVW